MRVLSIDHGGRRIGLAVSDPLGMFARPLKTIDRRVDRDPIGRVIDVVEELDVDRILLGMPIETSGQAGESAARVRRFQGKLEARLSGKGMPIAIDTLDEAYTTTEARARLLQRGVPAREHKPIIDQEAAAVLLEEYLRTRTSGS